ncbi:hypothetical protein ESCO_000776 [Escovopsis weberi]|uniref:Uncharacterized protein n=1 Tax=Escovopsis weberi TaxID=150374 RepID=A0A0M8N2L4_ESCWE|nr:hypothetical protein ESCO_000776 [Escovopsis weberi]
MGGDDAQYGFWPSDARVQEVETGGESDSGDAAGKSLVTRRRSLYQGPVRDDDLTSEEDNNNNNNNNNNNMNKNKKYYDDEDDDDDDDDDDDEDLSNLSPEMEEALVQSALARISKAQARGRTDVQLSKAELAALEMRRQRLEEEEEERRRRRKRKEQRVTVSLAQFESLTRKTKAARQASAEGPAHLAVPPMGYFPPMGASRSQAQRHSSSSSGGSGTGSDPSYRPSRSSTGSVANLDEEMDEVEGSSAVRSIRGGVRTRASTKSIEHVVVDEPDDRDAGEQSHRRVPSGSLKARGTASTTAAATNGKGLASVRGSVKGRGATASTTTLSSSSSSVRGTAKTKTK